MSARSCSSVTARCNRAAAICAPAFPLGPKDLLQEVGVGGGQRLGSSGEVLDDCSRVGQVSVDVARTASVSAGARIATIGQAIGAGVRRTCSVTCAISSAAPRVRSPYCIAVGPQPRMTGAPWLRRVAMSACSRGNGSLQRTHTWT